jgi:hypothetical protein
MSRTNSARPFGIAGIYAIAGSLVLSVALAFLAATIPVNLPWDLNEHLFFAPQYLFCFNQIVKRVLFGFETLFSPAGAWTFGIALWSMVAAGYGWLTKRLPLLAVVLLAPIAIIVTTILVHRVFSAMGYFLELDGP